VIAIPSHPCLPCDPAREAPMTYGELGVDNVATCSLRIRWGTGERAPGCGARIALCHGCGLRTRVNGAPCGACGGTERPTQVLTAERARASESVVDRAGSIAPPEPMVETVQPTETKPKAPRRAPTKRSKPAAGHEANDLPLFK
jgi:hypothetical protein